ncbi:hypothetical protein VTI74DRAFT_5470 [Chaetomium olivicolor]
MRFSIAAVFAFAASLVQAQVDGFNPITKPSRGEVVVAGSTYEIVWEPSAAYPGSITIGLLGGSSPSTLSIVDTIAKGVDPSKGSYPWKVDSNLGDLATYGIIITLESDTKIFQYGFPFKIKGTSTGGSTTATGTAAEPTTATGKSTSKTGSASSSSAITSTTVVIPSSTIISSTIRSNLSTTSTGSVGQATITSLVTQQRPTSTTTATHTIVTNGVASIAAGSFALFGGVLAAFAL